MRKLITANFHRFSKDRFSWCVLGIVVILSLGNVFNSVGSFETMAASGYAVSLDEYYFNQAPLIGAFLALLISMFLGTEFSEGTIRNKLCIGHKRDEIFLSNFISCAFASIVLTVVWLLSSGLLFGLIGPLEMEVSKFIGCIFVAVGFAVSFAALYTVIGSLSSNKAMTIIYTFAVFIILVMAASALYDRLSEPEMHTGMTIVGSPLAIICQLCGDCGCNLRATGDCKNARSSSAECIWHSRQAAFYSGRTATPEPVQKVQEVTQDDDTALLMRLLQNPEMSALLKTLAKNL